MNTVLKKVAEALKKYSGKRLAIGVSGGRDSMCLLHAVLHCEGIDKDDVVVVHVNHSLRDTADRDENFVRNHCARAHVKCIIKRVDVKRLAQSDSLTVEQAARNLRYGVFRDLIKSGMADVVLTAHHALDNAESVLMHIFRGAGLDGGGLPQNQ